MRCKVEESPRKGNGMSALCKGEQTGMTKSSEKIWQYEVVSTRIRTGLNDFHLLEKKGNKDHLEKILTIMSPEKGQGDKSK
jgi:hypothetical protein